MPRSPAVFGTSDRRSVLGIARENPLLIKRHRLLKSLSPDGKVHRSATAPSVAYCWCPTASLQANVNAPAKQPRHRCEKGGAHGLASPFRAAS